MWFAVPGDLELPTGGYEYARRVLEGVPGLRHLQLPGGFPVPGDAELRETAGLLAGIPADDVVLFDGLALGAMPGWCLDALRARLVALVHHPLCLETGVAAAAQAALRRSETLALARAAHVITTSRSTADLLVRDFGVTAERLSVAEPGTAPALRAARVGSPQHLLSAGAVTPRKGYDVLVEALAGLGDLDWRLTIAGDLTRNPACAALLAEAVAVHGLGGRVTLTGTISDTAMAELYAGADVFVSSAHHEGYGMAAADALAYGLPLVVTRAGALSDTIPADAAVVCAPGDVDGLRRALALMLTDAVTRERCAEASWQAGQRLPRWADTARIIAGVLGRAG